MDKPSPDNAALADVVALLLDGVEPGEALLDAFQHGSGEAAFWLLAGGGYEGDLLDQAARDRAAAFFFGAPDWVKRDYAAPFAQSLLGSGDSEGALRIADALAFSAQNGGAPGFENLANFIRGDVYQAENAVGEAISFYGKVAAPWNDPLVIETKLRHIALSWSTGAIKNAEAASRLEELDRDWRGDALGARIKLALARIYAFSDRLYESFLILDDLYVSTAPEDFRTEARSRLKLLTFDAFAGRAREYSLIAHLHMYDRFKSYSLTPKERLVFDIAAARRFASAGLHAFAADILSAYEAETLTQVGAGNTLTAAETLIDINKPHVAADVLTELDSVSLAESDQQRLAMLHAKVAAPEASDASSPEIAEIIAERAWRNGLWDVYNKTALPDDEPGNAIPRKSMAAYLATGLRPVSMSEAAHPVLTALAAQGEPEPKAAADLRLFMTGADAVIGLAPLLSAPSAPSPGEGQPASSAALEQG
ncbi:hypothetical protein [Hyphococcus sp.]|uniref:hypothetical protein n=1 Tax=Hyphococcus sp. TaxID=2038636 RepID=UPI003D0EC3D6